ncbi:hypothetical protein BsWGS_26677 [Bradybaena similaris]
MPVACRVVAGSGPGHHLTPIMKKGHSINKLVLKQTMGEQCWAGVCEGLSKEFQGPAPDIHKQTMGEQCWEGVCEGLSQEFQGPAPDIHKQTMGEQCWEGVCEGLSQEFQGPAPDIYKQTMGEQCWEGVCEGLSQEFQGPAPDIYKPLHATALCRHCFTVMVTLDISIGIRAAYLCGRCLIENEKYNFTSSFDKNTQATFHHI